MNRAGILSGLKALVGAALLYGGSSQAQQPHWQPFSSDAAGVPATESLLENGAFTSNAAPVAHRDTSGCPTCGAGSPCSCDSHSPAGGCVERGFYAGVDFLFVRPHFSEAVAFVTVTDSLTPAGFDRRVQASELDFEYEPSFRALLGYQLDNLTTLQFTYWHFAGDTAVGSTVAQPNQTIVDPFGNTVSLGQSIDTFAEVRTNVYDLDITKSFISTRSCLSARLAAGLRIADIDQFYASEVFSAAGALTSRGDFTAEFVGAGPHLGFEGRSWFGTANQFSLLAKGSFAILIGDYDVASGVRIPGMAAGSQQANRTRAVPVLEAELGAAWRPTPAWTISGGWLFQAWFNVGTSGGTFDGELLVPPVDAIFVGTDDADIMSFDGLFVRSELRF